MSESFLRNSHIVSRAGDGPLFIKENGAITVRLDGYVICPVEKLQEFAAQRALGLGVDADEPTPPI